MQHLSEAYCNHPPKSNCFLIWGLKAMTSFVIMEYATPHTTPQVCCRRIQALDQIYVSIPRMNECVCEHLDVSHFITVQIKHYYIFSEVPVIDESIKRQYKIKETNIKSTCRNTSEYLE